MTFARIAVLAAALAVALPAAASAQTGAFNWSGAYVGAQVGYGWGATATGATHLYQDAEGTDEFDDLSPLPGFNYAGTGAIGGAEAGYNWQSGQLVFGVVGDIAAANIRGTYDDSSNLFSVDSTIKWLGTARVNLGIAVTGDVLLYGTGGLAVGGVEAGLHDYYDDGNIVLNSSSSTTNIGWTAGGGIAAALNSNWIIKAEYLYVDLGLKDVTFHENPVDDFGFPLITSSAKTTASLLKVSLDYKF